MKISKLFHWLYALVMLLPIFAILSTILVNTFNQKANDTTETTIIEVPVYYDSNEVNSYSDIRNGNYYHFECNDISNEITEFFVYTFDEYNNIHGTIRTSGQTGTYGQVPYIRKSTNANEILFSTENVNQQYDFSNIYSQSLSFDFLAKENNINYLQVVAPFISKCNYQYVKEYTQEEQITYVQNDIFYYAVDKVENSPLFSWAYDSFLTAPFSYIVSLFGMPTNHVVVELLSYWLAISIIWLVFDLVMYVPLLVHRWLDKGVLE